MNMKKCIKCKKEIPKDMNVCKYCGAKQPINAQPAPASTSGQTLGTAEAEASADQKVAKSESASATRDALEEPNNSSIDDKTVSEARQKASEAHVKASEAENEAKAVSAKTQKESRQAQSLNHASRYTTTEAQKQHLAEQRRLNKQKQATKNKRETRVRQQEQATKQTEKSVLEEIGALVIPVLGFIIVAELTHGASRDGMVAMLGMIIFALGGAYCGLKAMVKYKIISILMFIWNALVVLAMFLAVLG